MFLNLTKSGNVLKIILLVKNPSRTKNLINIMPVEENFDCRRKKITGIRAS